MAIMTIEERDTAAAIRRAANEITKHFNEPKTIDWEQRHYEIAKEVLPTFLQLEYEYSRGEGIGVDSATNAVNNALTTAGELIKQLKALEL